MAQTDTKQTFTVAEANRLLPLVRSIVSDVVAEYRRIREIERERRAVQVGAGVAASSPDEKERARRQSDDLKHELEERSQRIDSYIKEVADLGAEVKDLDKGLVDFPSLRGGRAIWLCWNLGEDSVSHWHGISETADDRRPIESPKRAAAPPAAAPPALPGELPVDPKAQGPTTPPPSALPPGPGSGPKAANGRGGEARGGDKPA